MNVHVFQESEMARVQLQSQPPADPWMTVGKKNAPDNRSFLEIQREEELAARRQRAADLLASNDKKEDEWTRVAAKPAWNTAGGHQTPSPPLAGQAPRTWNAVQAPKPVPIPKEPSKSAKGSTQSKAKSKSPNKVRRYE